LGNKRVRLDESVVEAWSSEEEKEGEKHLEKTLDSNSSNGLRRSVWILFVHRRCKCLRDYPCPLGVYDSEEIARREWEEWKVREMEEFDADYTGEIVKIGMFETASEETQGRCHV
jgi:hypothetical protein